jgi:hypothetical protein
MQTTRERVAHPEAAEQLKKEVVSVRNLIRSVEKNEKTVANIRVTLGKELIKLKDIYHRAFHSKRSGFTKWAAEQFKRSPKTIEHYMYFGRTGTTEREDHRQQNPVTRAKNAFSRLGAEQRVEFLYWLDAILSKDHSEGEAVERRASRASLTAQAAAGA